MLVHNNCTPTSEQVLANKIRSLDEGFLDVMESKPKSHTLSKHVSISKQDLLTRASKESLLEASSFNNKKTANLAIKQNLMNNLDDINTFLKNPKTLKLTIETNHKFSIGSGVQKRGVANTRGIKIGGKPRILNNLYNSRAILIKDNSDLGFYILTAFPIDN